MCDGCSVGFCCAAGWSEWRAGSGEFWVAMRVEGLRCSVRQAAVEGKELEMSTPGKVQVNAQVHTLVFQRFTPSQSVKIVTFAASWQNLDG